MKKTERVDFIMGKLEKLYPETPVPLNHSNLYELLIAVLLSAQCTDERVNKITPQLFKKANSPKKMCKLSIDEIYKIIPIIEANILSKYKTTENKWNLLKVSE